MLVLSEITFFHSISPSQISMRLQVYFFTLSVVFACLIVEITEFDFWNILLCTCFEAKYAMMF